MSVQSEITRLANAKTALATAIEGKGVTVPEGTKLDGMAALVEAISAGGDNVRFATGTFTIAGENVATYEVRHNFGIVPNFVFFMRDGLDTNSTYGICLGLLAQHADPGSYYEFEGTHVPYFRYQMARSSSISSASSAVSQKYYSNSGLQHKIYGVSDMNSETVTLGYNDTYPLMAGYTYNWICAVIATVNPKVS